MTAVRECARCFLPERADHRCPASIEGLRSIYMSQCQNCSFALDNRGIEGDDMLYGFRAAMTRAAYEHVRDTGHRVHVTTTSARLLKPNAEGSSR